MNIHNNPLNFNSRVPRVELVQRKQRNYNQLKPVYQTMKWKQYAIHGPRKNSIDNVERLSAKNSIRQHNSPSYHESENYERNVVASRLSQRYLRQQNLRLSGTKFNPKDEEINRVKQDAVRRVKMLQEKVLPLISNEQQRFKNDDQEYGLGWQMKMQQKLIKMQNAVENMKNQMQIKFEKKLLEMDRIWQSRFNQMLQIYQMNNLGNDKQNGQQIGYQGQYQREQNIYQNQVNQQESQEYQQISNRTNGKYKYYRSGFNDQQNQQY